MDCKVAENDFEVLFKKHYRFVINQLYFRVKSKWIAEELAQEVFMQLYFTNWKEIENVPSWLIKASTFSSYNYLRSENRHIARVNKAAQYYNHGNEPSVEECFVQKETSEEVQNLLSSMSEKERTALLMQSSGFKYKEIAEALYAEPAGIGVLISRAKKKFAKLYQQLEGRTE